MGDWQDVSKPLAEQHVDWLLGMLRPLLIMHMEHGFKHGVEWERGDKHVGSMARSRGVCIDGWNDGWCDDGAGPGKKTGD